jgi:hypothetical protein
MSLSRFRFGRETTKARKKDHKADGIADPDHLAIRGWSCGGILRRMDHYTNITIQSGFFGSNGR